MADLHELVRHHGSVRRYRVKLAVEYADGFVQEIETPDKKHPRGLSADDMHRELIKTANVLALANIETDEREKQARSRRTDS
jgi:hypothetical protein